MAQQLTERGMSARVEGVPELLAQLGQLGSELVGPTASAALHAGALPFQNRWKSLVPVYTGTYKRDIYTQPEGGAAFVDEQGDPFVEVGTSIIDPPYPYFLEVGTSKMAARPSMRPAYDETQDQIVEEIAGAINQLLVQYGAR